MPQVNPIWVYEQHGGQPVITAMVKRVKGHDHRKMTTLLSKWWLEEANDDTILSYCQSNVFPPLHELNRLRNGYNKLFTCPLPRTPGNFLRQYLSLAEVNLTNTAISNPEQLRVNSRLEYIKGLLDERGQPATNSSRQINAVYQTLINSTKLCAFAQRLTRRELLFVSHLPQAHPQTILPDEVPPERTLQEAERCLGIRKWIYDPADWNKPMCLSNPQRSHQPDEPATVNSSLCNDDIAKALVLPEGLDEGYTLVVGRAALLAHLANPDNHMSEDHAYSAMCVRAFCNALEPEPDHTCIGLLKLYCAVFTALNPNLSDSTIPDDAKHRLIYIKEVISQENAMKVKAVVHTLLTPATRSWLYECEWRVLKAAYEATIRSKPPKHPTSPCDERVLRYEVRRDMRLRATTEWISDGLKTSDKSTPRTTRNCNAHAPPPYSAVVAMPQPGVQNSNALKNLQNIPSAQRCEAGTLNNLDNIPIALPWTEVVQPPSYKEAMAEKYLGAPELGAEGAQEVKMPTSTSLANVHQKLKMLPTAPPQASLHRAPMSKEETESFVAEYHKTQQLMKQLTGHCRSVQEGSAGLRSQQCTKSPPPPAYLNKWHEELMELPTCPSKPPAATDEDEDEDEWERPCQPSAN